MASGSARVVYAALGANACIAAAKFGVGLLTASTAMLAEAAHSLADTINQVFLLISIHLSDNPADQDHPYGYGKERFFWAFLAAIFIFVAGSFFSVYQGVERLLNPHEHEGPFWPSYLVLGIAFAFDFGVLIIAVREVLHQARERAQSIVEFMRTSSDVTLKTAVFEDVAATTGVVIAAAGVALVQITGESRYDAIASILIGVVLIAVAIMLGTEARDLLLGSAAEDRVQRAIREQIEQHPQVDHIVELLTMQLGLDSVLVTGRLELRDQLNTDEIEDVLDQLSDRIHANVPSVQNIYLEPHQREAAARSNE